MEEQKKFDVHVGIDIHIERDIKEDIGYRTASGFRDVICHDFVFK